MNEQRRRWVGMPLTRQEDVAFLTGGARYVADLPATQALHMRIVRSTVAHARIRSIDVSAAADMPGIFAVFTAADLAGSAGSFPIQPAPGAEIASAPLTLLAQEKVRFVGEPVAVVLAESEALAEDGASMVDVDYDWLEPVVSLEDSRSDRTLLHEELGSNRALFWRGGSGSFESAVAEADFVVRASFSIPRLAAAPMEPRGCLVRFDPASGEFDMWASAQDPHRPKAQLAQILGVDPESIRVRLPAVGGAFGSKGALAPEYALASWCARRTGRAVRWIEDRSENLAGSYQGRGIDAEMELALDRGGRFLGVRGRVRADLGAYLYPTTAVVPVTVGGLLCGAYRIPVADVEVEGYLTNKVPTGPYRGAGRPEAAYLVERMIDLAARRSGIASSELRRRNFIAPEEFPHRTALGLTYDSGDYRQAYDAAEAELDARRERLSSRVRPGAVVGSGLAFYIERAGPAFWERGTVTIDPAGRVVASSGSASNGQGHATAFAQVVADQFEVDPGQVVVVEGDSADGDGVGTFGSRSMTLGGEALALASRKVLELAGAVASEMLEADRADLRYSGGAFHVVGSPEREVTIFEVAAAAKEAAESELSATERFRSQGPVFPYGAYGALVELDLETGHVQLHDVVAVDDAGTVVNPMLAEGQVIGSTLQGVASALLEEVVYDADGQLLTGTLASYLVPSAVEASYGIHSEFRETATPYTTLGAKGLGESGTIGVPGAIANAVADALGKLGIEPLEAPFTPERLWRHLAGRSSATTKIIGGDLG